MQSLCGRSATELQQLLFRDLLTPAGGIFYETQFMPALRLRRTLKELSFEVAHADGHLTPVLASAVLETDPSGVPVCAVVALFEATQRRQYEKELLAARKDSEQMAEVVRRSSDAIIRLTPASEMRSWNDGAKQIFGYNTKEAVGHHFRLLLMEAADAAIAEAMEKLATGTDSICETIGRRKDGSTLNISVSLTAHLEPPGRIVGFSAIVRDITSRKVAERALMQAEKLTSVSRLASSIAHELNNPLAAVTNLLYLLNTGARDEETRALVTTAQRELARVSQIATHTLRFHRQSSRKTKVDIPVLFEEVVSLYKGRFAGVHIRTVFDCRSTSPFECFEGELRQVLVNLVSNAFDAMRHGGTLWLRSRDATPGPSGGPAVRISVADNGTGIVQEAAQHLFEPFFSTKGINGAGLGLWISKDLVARNGGRIRIRSSTRAERHGTVVTMTFPNR